MLSYNKRMNEIIHILIQEDIKITKVKRLIELLTNELDIYRQHTVKGKVLNKEEYKMFILSQINTLIPFHDMIIEEYGRKKIEE